MSIVYVLTTGGTISMTEDPVTHTVAPADLSAPTHDLSPFLLSAGIQSNVVFEEVFNLPSPHVTPVHMYQLAQRIQQLLQQKDTQGVVVTHGTDTLEETADLLDILIDSRKPVVVTGAMRSANELGADGPLNVLNSILTAENPASLDRGCLVVFNDEIHAARYVTKTHTSNVATFQSPSTGPVGIVDKRGVHYRFPILRRRFVNPDHLNAKVGLLKMCAGMDSYLLYAMKDGGYEGIVIEALGQGNVPPSMMDGIRDCIDSGIPVVLVSRCYNGIVQDVYAYEGGGKQLKSCGVIFSSGSLFGQKARMELIALLGAGYSLDQIKKWFETE